MTEATWLPNLVGGTSIWKLAVDLNEPKFFDGRLLVPETEGSESLPVTVRWDLTGLVPLAEAKAKHPDETAAAIKDFQACLERVAKVFSTPNSGFDRYKEAFTVPSLEADGGASYFYSPEKKKLLVVNWGASPRTMGGKAEYVFGYEDWAKHWRGRAAAGAGATGAAAVGGAAGAAAVASAAADDKKAKEDAKNDAKKESKARRWWVWPLVGLAVIALILLALFLLKACEHEKLPGGPDAEGATADSAALGADAAAETGADAASADGGEAGADAASADGGEAGADAASADGGEAGADAASADAGSGDGGRDGGLAMDDDDDDFAETSSGGTLSSGGTSGKVVVKIGPGGGAKTSVHRKHYSDEAQRWRVAAGAHKVSRTEQRGQRFDVWLTPGQTFEGVRVEWQDKAGKWHVH